MYIRMPLEINYKLFNTQNAIKPQILSTPIHVVVHISYSIHMCYAKSVSFLNSLGSAAYNYKFWLEYCDKPLSYYILSLKVGSNFECTYIDKTVTSHKYIFVAI